MKNIIFLSVSVVSLFLLQTGCNKENSNNPPEPPAMTISVLTTSSVTDIGETYANCGGNITSDGGSHIIARGICWSTDSTPTLKDSVTYDGTGTGSFSHNINVTNSIQPYFVRAYATNGIGTGFGEIVSFVTKPKKQEFSGTLDSVSPCKRYRSLQSPTDTTDSITCLFYLYQQDSARVILRHTDVYLNCCPDSMYVQATLAGDTVSIVESDDDGYCGCICLYDFTTILNGLEPKRYLVKISVVPYSNGQNTQFVMDLSRTTSGMHCYKRW